MTRPPLKLKPHERLAARVFLEGIGKFARCPFCGYDCEVTNPIRGCVRCRAGFRQANGTYIFARWSQQ